VKKGSDGGGVAWRWKKSLKKLWKNQKNNLKFRLLWDEIEAKQNLAASKTLLFLHTLLQNFIETSSTFFDSKLGNSQTNSTILKLWKQWKSSLMVGEALKLQKYHLATSAIPEPSPLNYPNILTVHSTRQPILFNKPNRTSHKVHEIIVYPLNFVAFLIFSSLTDKNSD
jgi:hypothetical protein